MIVGYRTERFITVQRHTDPAYGFQAFGIEVRTELHATKGWRPAGVRRQLLGPCERRDMHRAVTQGSSVTFRLNTDRKIRVRGVAAIPITEKMLMRHRERRRDIRRAANLEAMKNGLEPVYLLPIRRTP